LGAGPPEMGRRERARNGVWWRTVARIQLGGETVTKRWSILVVDDERVQCQSLAAWLAEDGYAVDTTFTGREAIEMARQKDYAIYFIDLKMPPGLDGIETMAEIRKVHPDAAIIIITAYATVDTAISAIKEGAQEYIVKPCNPQEISLLVERILKFKNLQRENLLLRKKLNRQYSFHDIISKSPGMHQIFDLIRDVASLRTTVLVEGESGTGKEMIARAVHEAGDRVRQPFVAVSCAALAETLLESELFGHERGAFTGAVQRRKGKFEMADGGSLFLDEIAEISPKLQLDLLRVLQEKSFFRVGGSEELHVDVRVIAATNLDLLQRVQEGKFREDLYYRLNVIHIRIPPLRDRREDVPLLARHFTERIALELNKEINDISPGALGVLMTQDWRGNVRQLENAVERAIVHCRAHVLAKEDFAFLDQETAPNGTHMFPAHMTLREMEKLMIEAALARSGGNIKEAAAALGIDRSTLYDKIEKYGIPRQAGTGEAEHG
jgi:DNA-binding NtrC family response regulator